MLVRCLSNTQDLHLDFISAATHLRAASFGFEILHGRDAVRSAVMQLLKSKHPFAHMEGLRSLTNERSSDILCLMQQVESAAKRIPQPLQLEKDDDSNFYMTVSCHVSAYQKKVMLISNFYVHSS